MHARTIEAVIDENGAIKLAEPIKLNSQHRALVTILNEPPTEQSLHERHRSK